MIGKKGGKKEGRKGGGVGSMGAWDQSSTGA